MGVLGLTGHVADIMGGQPATQVLKSQVPDKLEQILLGCSGWQVQFFPSFMMVLHLFLHGDGIFSQVQDAVLVLLSPPYWWQLTGSRPGQL